LGEELGLDRSTIADLVRRMESAGLLKRRRDDEDRRRNTLELTPLGRAELERLSPLVDAVQVELVETLEAAEVRTLRELLLRVIG
ncbi:MAG TPA: MarR family winged helix-turn-helix transcriptional regulator, partial [Microbacteriaceae bacterium]|nr:MarR family winged helix-turn-helix transcriptional regulator [Microbacteriaceae bacterium]